MCQMSRYPPEDMRGGFRRMKREAVPCSREAVDQELGCGKRVEEAQLMQVLGHISFKSLRTVDFALKTMRMTM